MGYSKKIEIPECPYKCKGCKDKREYIVRNGKAKERIIKAGKVGTQRIYLIHRPPFRGFKMVTTIVELNTSKTIAILKSDKKEELKGFLNKIPYEIKQKITEAALDMRVSFKNAVKEELPGVKVVADHFHVVKDAQKKLRESIKIEEEVTNNNKKIPVRLFFLNGKKLLKEKKKVKKLYKTWKEHPYLKEYYRYLQPYLTRSRISLNAGISSLCTS
ncbi:MULTISPECIES: transposase [Petrotoga]|uniref:Transposase n=1 Tax=Petrotoga sibirica TaxID=156202 RepID=A0A4V3GPP1_9BACT|nr:MULTISPECIES: transposase [Petrotoga]TDX11803.1 transposase [Petrotoga sibirica]